MTPELARAALAFLGRADLKGVEALTFMQVCTALEAMAGALPPANDATLGVPEPTAPAEGGQRRGRRDERS